MQDTVEVTSVDDYKLITVNSMWFHDHLGVRSRKKCLATFGDGYRFGVPDLSEQEGSFFFNQRQVEELYALLLKAKELNWF